MTFLHSFRQLTAYQVENRCIRKHVHCLEIETLVWICSNRWFSWNLW